MYGLGLALYNVSLESAVPPSAELALTEQYPPTKFSTLKNLKKTVASAHDKLNEGDESHQYLSFSHVSPKQLESIEAHRHDLGGVRLTYFGDPDHQGRQ